MVYTRNYGQNGPLPNGGWNGVAVTDLDHFLPTLAKQITPAVETTFCRISLLDQNQENLTIQAACPIRELAWDPAVGRRYSLAALPKHRTAVQTKQPVLINKHASDGATSNVEWEGTLDPEIQSGALIPMVSAEGAWAIISLGEMRSWDRSPLTSKKVALCQTLADLATMALQKARLYEESNRELEELAALYRQKVRLFEQARRMSTTDHLTGLRNRRYLDKALARETAVAERYGGSFSLIMLDIDDFKQCNDLHGHLAGDAVLQELARILESHVRQVDAVVRYGGEEFIILLPQTEREGALEMGERIRRAVRAHSFANGKEGLDIRVTISLGTAAYPQDASGASELIARCDEALRAAKRAGKDGICAYSSITQGLT
jgi:diguanylate cyclase (GGDEF)-like protein